jgi:NAD-dependent DNA ligase
MSKIQISDITNTICNQIKSNNFVSLSEISIDYIFLFYIYSTICILKNIGNIELVKQLNMHILKEYLLDLITYYRINFKSQMDSFIAFLRNEKLTDSNIKKFVDGTSELVLRSLLIQLKDNYYNKAFDTSIQIPDKNFDILEKYSEARGIVLYSVGSSSNDDDELLPIPMGSMNKIKIDTTQTKIDRELKNKLNKIPTCNEFVLQDKLDGLSGLFEFNGIQNVLRLYTRGTGIRGSNISYLIPYINNLPSFSYIHSKLSNPQVIFYVKGELIMKKSTFKKHYTSASNPRNTGTGIINRDKSIAIPTLKKRQDIDFIAFELDKNSENTILDSATIQNENLINLGFTPVKTKLVNRKYITLENLENTLTEFRFSSDYDIDGIIVKCNDQYLRLSSNKNPTNAFAFKKDKIGVETTVKKIVWNLSKLGVYKPTIIVNQVVIDGKKIDKTSGHNIDYIVNNKIYRDAKVGITIAGDVIPSIQYVVPDNLSETEIMDKMETIYETIPFTNIIDENTVGDPVRNFEIVKSKDNDSSVIKPKIYTKDIIANQIFPKKLLSLIRVPEFKIKKIGDEMVIKIGEIFKNNFENTLVFSDANAQCQQMLIEFLSWSIDRINEITQFGSSSAKTTRTNLYQSINKILEADDKYIISGFGIMGPNIGVLLIDRFINYTYVDPVNQKFDNLKDILLFISNSDYDSDRLVSIFSSVPDVGPERARQFVSNAQEALLFIESIDSIRTLKNIQIFRKNANKIKNKKIENITKSGRNFVITGKKEPLKSIIEDTGGVVKGAVSGNTAVAIYSGESKSSKVIDKWEPMLADSKYTFTIMSESEFKKEFNI